MECRRLLEGSQMVKGVRLSRWSMSYFMVAVVSLILAEGIWATGLANPIADVGSAWVLVGVLVTLGGHLTLHAGTVYGFSGALSWAIATLLIKRWGPSLDIWVLTAYQMLFGGIVLLMGSVVLETPMFIITAESVFVLLWLAVMASVVQFGIWFYLLQHGDPGRVSTFLFLAPFFGVLFGWLLLQEPIAGGTLIGGSLIILGIALVNWPARITT